MPFSFSSDKSDWLFRTLSKLPMVPFGAKPRANSRNLTGNIFCLA
jgi:hypothetical protein